MATIVFGMNVSLDGYVDHDKFAPGPILFRHWIENVRGLAGSVYGRRMYELMHYWDEDQPDWTDDLREFAEVWRRHPKWVVSRTLTEVGPNATLVADDAVELVRRLRAELPGKLAVSGTKLAASLAGLIDEYNLYLHPVVLGSGVPMFAEPRPRLRFAASERIDEDVVRLTYVPA
jgi:dihydrofolate reductase